MRRSPRATTFWELDDDPRFELRRALGSGSFGAVYEVFDRERGAKVALKVLKRIEAEELYRFKQEFRALADSRRSLVGTPEYLAPELVKGHPATAASDWYAVGVMLFEALTHTLPFEGTLQEILARKITHDAPAPRDVVPDVPADLDRLCVELLARDADARPGSAELLQRFGSHAAPQSGQHELPFVGREPERTTLAEMFRAVRQDGAAAVALVGGVSGIGKSALVNRACAEIQDASPGAVIFAGRCWEQESVPYKAIDGLVDPLSRHLKALPKRLVQQLIPRDVRLLAQLFPVLEQVDAIANAPTSPVPAFDALARRQAMFRALRELLTRLAQQRPLARRSSHEQPSSQPLFELLYFVDDASLHERLIVGLVELFERALACRPRFFETLAPSAQLFQRDRVCLIRTHESLDSLRMGPHLPLQTPLHTIADHLANRAPGPVRPWPRPAPRRPMPQRHAPRRAPLRMRPRIALAAPHRLGEDAARRSE